MLSLVIWYAVYSHQKMAQTVSPLTKTAIAGNLANAKCVRLDISFKTPSHTCLQTTQLQFPAATPLALVLKQFLADRTLDQSYSGGLSSYCLHEHHLGRSINPNIGRLLMDFVYFFGNVFDPRQMRGSVQGSGIYRNRERGHSIDPIHIDDPLESTWCFMYVLLHRTYLVAFHLSSSLLC
ncbi:hypothetical protein HID58_053191 [Brassica napus]|uniref:PAP-associated domain-containing protein n=1 Tax=Brassica napus TaxID=3708 RepID=A0ABQ8AE05_BRANA|nr:hypothetical protein HID58_053191 [Brassica napus]